MGAAVDTKPASAPPSSKSETGSKRSPEGARANGDRKPPTPRSERNMLFRLLHGRKASGGDPQIELAVVAGESASSAATKPRVEQQAGDTVTQASTALDRTQTPGSESGAGTAPAEQRSPAQPTAEVVSSSKDIPKVEEMQQRLAEGIKIGGVTFHASSGENPAEAVARGLREILNRKGEGGSIGQADLECARYAVATAQVAGVSTDQLRFALDEFYPPLTIKNSEGKDMPNPKYAETSSTRKTLELLGLREEKPASAQDANEQDRQTAEQNRKNILVDIVKISGAKDLPERDIRESAEEIVNERLQPKSDKKKDTKRAQELQEVIMQGTADTLAKIIADPTVLTDDRRLKLADLVKERIKIGRVELNGKKKRWWQFSKEEQAQILTNEQLRAFVANPTELQKLEEEYKGKKPLWLVALQLFLGLVTVTTLDLIRDQSGDMLEGG